MGSGTVLCTFWFKWIFRINSNDRNILIRHTKQTWQKLLIGSVTASFQWENETKHCFISKFLSILFGRMKVFQCLSSVKTLTHILQTLISVHLNAIFIRVLRATICRQCLTTSDIIGYSEFHIDKGLLFTQIKRLSISKIVRQNIRFSLIG